jgi:hypothetical protein
MPIGNHSHGGGILVGIGVLNTDKIYYEHGNGIELIEPDIFSFIKNLIFLENDEIETKGIYKGWKDEYWRKPQ